MKVFYYGFLFLILFASCKKGEKLSQEVTVQLVAPSDASVSPEDHFPQFDPYDFFEVLQYPRYAHDLTPEQIAKQFNNDLRSYLKDNNIKLQEDSAQYKLVIHSLELNESLDRHSYDDLCFPSAKPSYVYSSSLEFKARASLYKEGTLVDSWKKEGNSWERVKSDVTDCNAPKIGIMVRRSSSLIDQVAKELRVLISKKMKELES